MFHEEKVIKSLYTERALDAMVLKYINGDSSVVIKRHHVPVYKSKKSLDEKKISKVLKRMKDSKKV